MKQRFDKEKLLVLCLDLIFGRNGNGNIRSDTSENLFWLFKTLARKGKVSGATLSFAASNSRYATGKNSQLFVQIYCGRRMQQRPNFLIRERSFPRPLPVNVSIDLRQYKRKDE